MSGNAQRRRGPTPEESPMPLFVLGAQRSGTTWTANLLAAHPQVAAVQSDDHFGIHESIFFSHFARAFGDLDDDANFDRFVAQFVTSDYYVLSGPGARLDTAAAAPELRRGVRRPDGRDGPADGLRLLGREVAAPHGARRRAGCRLPPRPLHLHHARHSRRHPIASVLELGDPAAGPPPLRRPAPADLDLHLLSTPPRPLRAWQRPQYLHHLRGVERQHRRADAASLRLPGSALGSGHPGTPLPAQHQLLLERRTPTPLSGCGGQGRDRPRTPGPGADAPGPHDPMQGWLDRRRPIQWPEWCWRRRDGGML